MARAMLFSLIGPIEPSRVLVDSGNTVTSLPALSRRRISLIAPMSPAPSFTGKALTDLMRRLNQRFLKRVSRAK